MFGYYLKLSGKVVMWHLIGQIVCMCVGFVSFGLLMLNYRIVDILVAVLMSGGYAIYMYSKLYKVGERDTKSYVQEKPYACKGMVLSVLLTLISLAFALLYGASFTMHRMIPEMLMFYPFRIWGYTYSAFIKSPTGSISWFYWLLYFGLPFACCTLGYLAGMRRFEFGHKFFTFLAFRKKD